MKIEKKEMPQIEAYLYVNHDFYLTEKQKELLLTVGQTMKEVDTHNDLYYFTKIKSNNITLFVEIRSSYSGYPYISFNERLIKYKDNIPLLQKFYCGGVLYDNVETVKDNTVQLMLDNHILFKSTSIQLQQEKVDIDKILSTASLKTGTRIIFDNEFKEFILKHTSWDELEIYKDYFKDARKNVFTANRKICIVAKVWEGKNTRFALLVSMDENSIAIDLIGITPSYSMYDFLDVNRFILLTSYKSLSWHEMFIAFDVLEDKDAFSNLYKQYTTFSKRIHKNESSYFMNKKHLTNDEVLSNSNKIYLQELKEKREKDIAEMKNKRYQESLDNMDTKAFKKNDISFTKFTMEYEGITCDFDKLFDFQYYLKNSRIDNIADFNTILDNVLRTIGLYFVESNPSWNMTRNLPTTSLYNKYETFNDCDSISFSVDGKTITLTSEPTEQSTKYKVNNIRINKYEIMEVLTHILCHPTIEDYNKFLKSVSSCSLKFHKAISRNIKKKYSNRYHSNTNSDGIIELKMIRKKGRNYITIGKKDYSIKDTNTLIDRDVNGTESLVALLLSTINVSIKDIKPIIEDGKERYIVALRKSKLLLDTTLKRFNVSKETIGGKTGYVVTGKSGTRYLVEDNSNNRFKTWVIRSDEKLDYRCIVDKTQKGQVGKDALVSRIFALSNDTMIAESVYTIKGDV